MPLTKGQILYDRYRIDALLAQGGMGAVYDAFDTRLNVRCAIKENLLFTEASTRQFEREARMLAALRHPNLPRVTDHFLVAGQGQYLVMDFIEGEDLNQRLKRRGPQAEADVLRWADDVLGALAYLHKRNIIHRDIKPNNVKIAPDGEAVLVDFGIAKELVDEAGMTTTTGARGLTPGFAPPEQYGTGRTDARSDIYAFGATLYTLLTGTPPADALSRMTKPEKFVPLTRHPIKVSDPAARGIDRALELDADARWPGAEDMRAALRERQVAPKPAPAKMTDDEATLPPGAAPLHQPTRLTNPTMALIVAGIVGLLALIAVAVTLGPGRGASAAATNTVEPTATERVATATVRATNMVAPSKTPAPPTSTHTHTVAPPTNTATFTVTNTAAVPPTNTRAATKAQLPTQTATQLTSSGPARTTSSSLSNLQIIAEWELAVKISVNYVLESVPETRTMIWAYALGVNADPPSQSIFLPYGINGPRNQIIQISGISDFYISAGKCPRPKVVIQYLVVQMEWFKELIELKIPYDKVWNGC